MCAYLKLSMILFSIVVGTHSFNYLDLCVGLRNHSASGEECIATSGFASCCLNQGEKDTLVVEDCHGSTFLPQLFVTVDLPSTKVSWGCFGAVDDLHFASCNSGNSSELCGNGFSCGRLCS